MERYERAIRKFVPLAPDLSAASPDGRIGLIFSGCRSVAGIELGRNRVRVNGNLLNGIKLIGVVQSHLENIFLSENRKLCILRAVPPRQEGRTRRHERGVGCGGRGCDARRAALEADGQAVWSWRSEAGAKAAESFADDGGNQAMVTGESAE